jgi:hypothetical protein
VDTEAYQNHVVWMNNLIQQVDDISTGSIAKYLSNEHLIEFKYLGEGGGIRITHKGIVEIERLLENPESDTEYFPAYSINNILKDQWKKAQDIFLDLKEKRSLFLHKVYEITGANEGVFINAFDVGKELGFECNKTIEKVYEYLSEGGLIVSRYSGGGLSISHKGIVIIQGQLENPINISPNKMVNQLIDCIEDVNNLCKSKLRCKIFKPPLKDLNDLRNIIDSEEGFISTILRISNIIDAVYYEEIERQIKVSPQDGSLDFIVALFNEKNVNYKNEDIDHLRLLHRLRNTKRPIHNAEYKAITILRSLGIDYPISNWERAGQTCLYHFMNCINNLRETLRQFSI